MTMDAPTGARARIQARFDDPLVQRAATEGHRVVLGPGEPALSEWAAAGLPLPDLDAMQRYRVGRIREQLTARDLAGALLFDPMNLMYATHAPNMQLWFLHNEARWLWVPTEGPIVLFDYPACEFLSAHNPMIAEVRPTTCFTYFLAGERAEDNARQFAAEIAELARSDGGGNMRIACDPIPVTGVNALLDEGIVLSEAMAIMEPARSVKGPDEILAMRCSVEACRVACRKTFEAMQPGMTEQQLWGVMWAEMFTRGGDWMECRLLTAGKRTNPWFQECSSNVIQEGDLVAFDTDMVGAYSMMTDISRTWIAGGGPLDARQQHVFSLAREQMERNVELLQPGITFHDLCHKAWKPPVDEYRHYSVLFHGVGQCDEWPSITFPASWERVGYDGVVQPGMVLTVEAYVGAYAGGQGVKLENQVLITENGHENLSPWSLEPDAFDLI
ncbi:MAG: aminopeptidase P family protein [Actinobacteria bacterium]|nr:aminopeptidase P family protein [Actinomycetota bacterium]